MIAFGELANMTGHRYYKAVHILDSIAKVKSCLLMLDLECDTLVLDMLEQFLLKIRTNHPPTVLSAMETIMTLIIEESDEIAPELLSLLISHVKIEKKVLYFPLINLFLFEFIHNNFIIYNYFTFRMFRLFLGN